jgi:NADH dehydrogenase FAD-containing subunit
VVGGGPTGLEMAGAIAELAKRALAADFRSIDPRCARVILIEAGPRLLAPFDPSLSEAARRSLEQLGVEVRLGVSVTDCDAQVFRLAESACKRARSFGLPALRPRLRPNGSTPNVIALAASKCRAIFRCLVTQISS